MKFYEKFLYHATAYSVAVTLLFFAFASMMRVSNLSLSFGRFALIIAFSLVMSTAEFVFSVKRIARWGQYIIHYLVLALAFFAIFLSVRKSTGEFEFTAATVFAAIVIFTVFYFIGVGIVFAFRKALAVSDDKIKAKNTKENVKKSQNYTPKFKKK